MLLKYYLTLNLSFPATDEAIRQAYLELVKQYPPERYPKEFEAISEAYEALKDETTRTHTAFKGFLSKAMPEEEILALGQLAMVGRPVGLSDLLQAEREMEAPESAHSENGR